MAFIDEFADMFPETITAQPGTLDGAGKFTASGAAVVLPCYYEGGPKLVRNPAGQEVVSSLRAFVSGTPNLTPHLHRFTIPSRFSPNTLLHAIAVDRPTDEEGPVYEEVALP